MVPAEKNRGPEGKGRKVPDLKTEKKHSPEKGKREKEEMMLELICIGLFLGLALSTLGLVAGLDRMMGDEP